jgi:hypothetical protein
LVLQRRAVETLASMTGRLGMDATATGDAFALFGAASGLAAFLVDHLAPARLRGAVATCLVALGATMPLYLVVHGTVEVDVLMTFDGLLGDDGHGALMPIVGLPATSVSYTVIIYTGITGVHEVSNVPAPVPECLVRARLSASRH